MSAITSENLFLKHSENLVCRSCQHYLSEEGMLRWSCGMCGHLVSDDQRVSWVICCELCNDFRKHWRYYASGMDCAYPTQNWRAHYVGICGGAVRAIRDGIVIEPSTATRR